MRDQQHGRRDRRQGDVAEAHPRARAVDPRGLVQVLVHRLQPGEEDDHVVAEALPRDEQQDRGQRGLGIAEPVDRRDAERAPARN